MFTIGLFPNTKKQAVAPILDWLIQFLQAKKVPVVMPEEAAAAMNRPELGCSRELLTEVVTVALTLGGDGTLLSTTRELAPHGIAVCGINMGQLGFLTEIELADLAPSLEKLINGQYYIEERQMLDAAIIRGNEQIVVASSLNDVVVANRIYRLFVVGWRSDCQSGAACDRDHSDLSAQSQYAFTDRIRQGRSEN